jgi:hypothetical protein
MHPELRSLIDRVIVPALADRFLRDCQARTRRMSARREDAVDEPFEEPGYDAGGFVSR